jgi:predicted Zn-dependent protease
LPGGPIYVHSGLIAAADNEAQLAGVLAHEIGHVVLRHSTNQASKAAGFQLLAAMAGGALGGGESMLGSLAQMGIGFGLNSAMLKYSRSAESDSDIVGARNLAAAGYNPVEMATFFQKLDDSGGARGPQFFSSHPNPGNRVKSVTEEIQDYRSGRYITNTKEFPSMKARAASIQPVKQPDKSGQGETQTAQPGSTRSEAPKAPAAPAATRSDGTYRAQNYILKPPMGWKAFPAGESDGVTIVPDNGTMKLADGSIAVARGLMAGIFPSNKNQADATSDLIRNLQGDNPKLQVMAGQRRSMRFGGASGESVFLQSESPIAGEREYVWMVTAKRSKGLFYLLMISPAGEYNSLRGGFEEVVKSVKFR